MAKRIYEVNGIYPSKQKNENGEVCGGDYSPHTYKTSSKQRAIVHAKKFSMNKDLHEVEVVSYDTFNGDVDFHHFYANGKLKISMF